MAYHLKYDGQEIDKRLDLAGTALQAHQDISHLATKNEVNSQLVAKVDKEDGKGLSSEDYTTEEKQKLANLDDTIKQSVNELQVEVTKKQDIIVDLKNIREGASKGATSVQPSSLAKVATSGSYNDLSDKPTIPSAVTESTVGEWGFAKSSALQTKAEDSSVVHKTGNETITGAKTFNSGVNFLGSGDSNAITLSTNTRINVNGTNKTVLGFGSGTFYINHGDYSLLLRGKDTRPKYNSVTLALSSDVNAKQDNLVSGTNIKTINGQSLLGSGNITVEGGASLTESDIAAMGFTKNTGTYSKPSGGIPKSDLASEVQTSLGKAETALQSIPSQYVTESELNEKGYATTLELTSGLSEKASVTQVQSMIAEAITNTINASY